MTNQKILDNAPKGATHYRKKLNARGHLYMINIEGSNPHHFIWLGHTCGGWSKMPFKHPNLHTFTECKEQGE